MNTVSNGVYRPVQRLHSPSLLNQFISQAATGCLQLSSGSSLWFLHLEQGKLVYASDLIDPFGRLDRHLRRMMAQVAGLTSAVRVQVRLMFETPTADQLTQGSDYQAISWLVEQQYLTPQQAAELIEAMVREVVDAFLPIQTGSYELIEQDLLAEFPKFCQLDLAALLAESQTQMRYRQSSLPSFSNRYSEASLPRIDGSEPPADSAPSPDPAIERLLSSRFRSFLPDGQRSEPAEPISPQPSQPEQPSWRYWREPVAEPVNGHAADPSAVPLPEAQPESTELFDSSSDPTEAFYESGSETANPEASGYDLPRIRAALPDRSQSTSQPFSQSLDSDQPLPPEGPAVPEAIREPQQDLQSETSATDGWASGARDRGSRYTSDRFTSNRLDSNRFASDGSASDWSSSERYQTEGSRWSRWERTDSGWSRSERAAERPTEQPTEQPTNQPTEQLTGTSENDVSNSSGVSGRSQDSSSFRRSFSSFQTAAPQAASYAFDAAPQASEPTLDQTWEHSTSSKTYTIACIDDSPTVLQAIKGFLDDKSLSVVLISDPVKALMQIIRTRPDLILLDVTMPNLDGYELCSLLRKHPGFRNTPIVMVTSSTGFIDRAKAKLVGSSGYLTKPFTQTDLLKIVFKHLN